MRKNAITSGTEAATNAELMRKRSGRTVQTATPGTMPPLVDSPMSFTRFSDSKPKSNALAGELASPPAPQLQRNVWGDETDVNAQAADLLLHHQPGTFVTFMMKSRDQGVSPKVALSDFSAALRNPKGGEWTSGHNTAMQWAFNALEPGDRPRATELLLEHGKSQPFVEVMKAANHRNEAPKLGLDVFTGALRTLGSDDHRSGADDEALRQTFSCLSGADRSKAAVHMLTHGMPNAFGTVIKSALSSHLAPTLRFEDFGAGLSALYAKSGKGGNSDTASRWAFSCLPKEDRARGLEFLTERGMHPSDVAAIARDY